MGNMALALEPRQTPLSIYQPESIHFDDSYFDKFIDYTDRKESTVKGYLTCIRQFALWLHENNITTPTRDDIKAYREHLETSGLATSTQAQYLRAVKHFFRWTAAEGIYPNIADNIHGAKVRHDVHKKDALGRDDVAKIADTIDRTTETGKRDYAIYMICITAGLRCIELHRADVGDIKTVGDRTYLYVQGKGHDDKDAPVLIIPVVKEALDDYLQTRAAKATAKSPLFTSTSNRSKGGRISATTLSTIIKNILVNAGYDSDRLTAHSLRHTSGTGAYMATGDIYQAQKHQRHADVSTTEIYIHAQEREERDTEQQVYNYYFDNDDTTEKRQAAIELINNVDPADLDDIIDYIKEKGGKA